MITTDVLVIGSSAAGLVAATTAKKLNPTKEVTVVTMLPKTLIPCGIPYVFGTVGSTENDLLPVDKMFSDNGINTIFDEATNLRREVRVLELRSGEKLKYNKLILATGSKPYLPE